MSKKKPLVTIIIPTYKRVTELRRALQSCINQSWKQLEIVVINDDPETSLMSLEKEYPHINYIYNDRNVGAPQSRNRGLEIAKGEFINFLDDDDELYPDKIKRQMEVFEKALNKNIGVVTCDVLYSGKGKEIVAENRMRGYIYHEQLTRYCVYGPETMLIKKHFLDLIGGFDTTLESNQEYDLSIRLSRVCEFEIITEVLTRKNESSHQITYNFKKKLFGTFRLYRKYNRDFLRAGIRVFLYNQVRFSYLIVLYTYSWVFGDRLYRRWSRI